VIPSTAESKPGPSVRLVEVGPRDGLQNERATIPTTVKVAFVDALSRTGLQEIEVSSFVSPQWVPQLADAEEVFRRIQRRPGVVYSALVPNHQGLDRALQAEVDKIAVFTAASETFARQNINATIGESIARFRSVIARANVPVRGYVSTAFRCPFEGSVAPTEVLAVVEALLSIGCMEVSIGDTIGSATPAEVERLLEVLLRALPAEVLAMHFHDTHGQAVSNAAAAAALGVRIFDGSAGGLGGCPYAPGAPGNVATEALVRFFGSSTGVDLERLEEASGVIRSYLRTGGP